MEREYLIVQWRRFGFWNFVFYRFTSGMGTVMLATALLIEGLLGTSIDAGFMFRIALRSYLAAMICGLVFWHFKKLK